MKIMSLDASSKSTGLAIFDNTQLIYYTCITASSNDPIARIQTVTRGIKEVLEQHPIDKIIMEEVIPERGQRMQTYRILMWVQAAVAFLIHDIFPKVTIEYVAANSWRAACGIKTGSGIKRDVLKEKDMQFVKDQYNLTVNDDIADAIGIGHAFTHQLKTEINWG